MKYLKYTILFFFVMLTVNGYSQSTLRHKKGGKGIFLGTTFTNNADGYQFGGRLLISPKLENNLQVNYLKGEKGFTNYSTFSVDNLLAYNFARIGNVLYFNLNAGCGLGYEKLFSSAEINDYKEGFTFYGIIGAKLNAYVIDDIYLFAEANQYFGYSLRNNYYAQLNIGIGFLLHNKKIKTLIQH